MPVRDDGATQSGGRRTQTFTFVTKIGPAARRPLIPQQRRYTRVLVGVTDRGVGISAENADRLFNAFFTTKSSGIGMDSRSAVRSLKPAVAACGPRQTYPTAPRFSSPCR
jgi:hypothetical protein